ncbi:MAG: transketolase [Ruthenibacterium sp.]
MDKAQNKELSIFANHVRQSILTGVFCAKSGHPGGSLSIADTLTYLYNRELHYDVKNPHWAGRDRFVLSKGHACPALYAVLAELGFFPKEELLTLRHTGALLQGHPDMKNIPGIDMSTGSLGQGISAACGMAISAKMSHQDHRIFTILGDGELQEGQVWEAAMFAAQHKLDNLIAVIDNNNLQIDGEIATICSPYPIDEKFAAFNWHVINVANAHDFNQLEAAFNEAKTVCGKPVAIIQKSVKGKGISYMENKAAWHGNAPSEAQYQQGMAELTAALAELEAE